MLLFYVNVPFVLTLRATGVNVVYNAADDPPGEVELISSSKQRG